MRKIVTALFVVFAFALSACGLAEIGAPPTTTLSPQQAAQAAYFYIVGEVNPLQQAIVDQYSDSVATGWGDMPAFCGEMANVLQRYGQLLATTVWPPEYQPQVTDVIAKNSLETQLYFQCAGLPGTLEAQGTTEQQLAVARDSSTGAVSALRGVLGLPIDR